MVGYILPLPQSLSIACFHMKGLPKKFYVIKFLGYALEHNSWELESNFNVEVLKECWDAIAKANDRLTHHVVRLDHKPLAKHKHLRQKVS